MKYTRPNESVKKKQLRAVQNQAINHSYQKEVPQRCPYCQGRMIIKTIGELDPKSRRANELICVCEHYGDSCTCSVKVKRGRDNKLYATGVPADEYLKSLRNEAHYYLDQLISFGICLNENEIYDALARNLFIQREQCHFSMFREERCKVAIRYMLKMLNNYPGKTQGRVRAYHSVSRLGRSYTDSDQEAQDLFLKIKKDEKDYNERH